MRLLSYNIHKGIGGRDRRYKLDRIIDVIAREEPDLICLQEVDRNVHRSSFHDQPADLAEAFRFQAALFQFNVQVRDGGYGNLVLARWPFRDKHELCLKRDWRKNRGAQIVVVDTPQGFLHLVNWHLGLAEKERHWQVRQLLEHDLFLRSSHLPTLIAGDYNDWRNTLGRGPFRRHGFQHVTSPASRFRSFPAYMPVAALDKVYVRGEIHVERVHLVKNRLARQASDHLPLVVDFHINGHGSKPAEGDGSAHGHDHGHGHGHAPHPK
jgi:endonuclease/exonuclease/phosphatase family metal-dependent hydrolase